MNGDCLSANVRGFVFVAASRRSCPEQKLKSGRNDEIMQKADSIPSDGTKAGSEQKVENIFVSSHDTKPNVVGSQSHGTPKSDNLIIESSPFSCNKFTFFSGCLPLFSPPAF